MVQENLVIQSGYVTRDPESTTLNNGGIVASFGLASNRRWNDRQSGELREEVTFAEWEFYGNQANTVMEYIKKSMPIYCRGRIRFQEWTDQATQQKRSRVTFVGDRFEFGGTRESNGLSPGQVPANAPANAAPAAQEAPPATDMAQGDDIPF